MMLRCNESKIFEFSCMCCAKMDKTEHLKKILEDVAKESYRKGFEDGFSSGLGMEKKSRKRVPADRVALELKQKKDFTCIN